MANTLPPSQESNYRAWQAMGQGGISSAYSGYLMAKMYEKTVAYEDTLSHAPYLRPEKYAIIRSKATPAQKVAAYRSFLRERNAAEPQDPDIKAAYEAVFANLGRPYAEYTEWKTSMLEKHGTALFLKPNVPLTPLADPTHGEICHIHGTNLSGHVTLSFADAEEVIGKGWGERHRMSGTDVLHLGYTMVYVPRNVQETEVFGRIFQAGLEFMRCVE